MLNIMLYASASLIWGATWLAIKLQLTQVPPILSVSYRFMLASLILLMYCIITGKRLKFSFRDHRFMMLQGVTLFGLSYCCSYLATLYLTSGLVAVVYSTILMWNILNLYLFMSQKIAWKAFWGGLAGLLGIAIIFRQDLFAIATSKGAMGLFIALGGAYLGSIGNIIGTRNARCHVPVTQANAFAMGYGGLLTFFIHIAMGGHLSMDFSFGYLGPMLYLSIFGSVIAFGCYMLLISRVGAEYAAYVALLMPLIALLISTFFEGYHWSYEALFGVALVLFGNLMILVPDATLKRLKPFITSHAR